MVLDEELLARLDLTAAVEAELTMSNRLMPRRPDRTLLATRANNVERLLRNRYKKGDCGTRADLVFVDKNRRGRRPISEMSLADRVLFRALVSLIAQSLPEHLVTRAPNQEFRRSPLSAPGVRYVSKTDVSSYYEYVDHDRLADELEAQTGEAPAIEVVMDLLRDIMGRRLGLPQVHRSSDILGDTYIDPVRRKMLRAGFNVTTYSDDFRIATSSLAEARQALEACAREVRSLGLTLNESKTFTYSAENYDRSLAAFAEAERKLFEESEGVTEDVRLLFMDDYPDESVMVSETAVTALAPSEARPVLEDDALDDSSPDSEATNDPAQTRAARRAWEIWSEEEESESVQSTTEAAITETLLGRALPILGRSGVEEPLDNLSVLLRYEPALTPQISTYITELAAATGPSVRTRIRRALDKLVQEENFSVWQKTWIAEAAGSVRPATNAHEHYEWLTTCLSDPEPSLAATAAAALGKLRRGGTPRVVQTLDQVGPVWRPLVFWAVARSDEALAETVAEDRLERLILEELRQ